MIAHASRFLTYLLTALILFAFVIVSFSPAWSATGDATVTMVGTVTSPGTLSSGGTSTATQTLPAARYDLQPGPIPSGQSWVGASFGIYLSQGRFATAPSVSITDSAGASIGVTATATLLAAGTGSTGGSASYQFSGDLPSGAILHFSGFALTGLSTSRVGTAVQIIAAAGGGSGAWRQYATWQTLATITSSGSTSFTPQTGWWWSSAESGRGYAIEVANGRLMLAAYMYRTDGTSVWYVASGPLTGTSFSGVLTEYRGGETLSGTWQAATQVGTAATVAISFASATEATIQWSGSAFGSSGATTLISRYSFTGSAAVTPPATTSGPQSGWYWNSDEPGTGWFLEMQGAQIFLAVYMYGSDGTARWYVAQGAVTTTGGVFGAGAGIVLEAALVEYANGQTLTSGARQGLLADPIGIVSVQFASPTSATAILPSGRRVSLSRFTQF